MNIHEHPNVKEYLAHFLLNLRKHSALTDETVFRLEESDRELSLETIEKLR